MNLASESMSRRTKQAHSILDSAQRGNDVREDRVNWALGFLGDSGRVRGGRPTTKATSKVFALMADEKARRIGDVAKALGIDPEQAYAALRSLSKQQVVHSFGDKRSTKANRLYALTDKGIERAAKVDAGPVRSPVTGRFEAPERPEMTPDDVVASSRLTRIPLEMHWRPACT